MDPLESAVNTLEAKKKYLEDWISGFREAGQVASTVNDHLELTRWELDALSNLPPVASGYITPSFADQSAQDFAYLQGSLPQLPKFDATTLVNSLAIATSGAATL